MQEENKQKVKPLFVVDCSVVMSWCFEDEFDEYSKRVLNALHHHSAIVPNLLGLEITNVLVTSEKKNKLTPAEAIRFIDLIENLPIYFSDVNFDMHELITSATSNNLTSYDTNYLLLAMHDGIPLATKDKALINACHKNGIQIFDYTK